MLCAKNLKAVKAALITILAVGGFTTAQAAFDLTSTEMGGLAGHAVAVYAAETVSTGSASGARRMTELHATAGVFDANATLSFPLGATDVTYYARYDLVAPDGVVARFVGLEADDFSGTDGTTATTFPGAGAGFDISDGSRVIYQLATSADDTVFTLDLDGATTVEDDTGTADVDEMAVAARRNQAARVQIGGSSAGGDYKVQLRLRIYDNIPGAISGVGANYIDAMKPIIAVDNTLSVTAAAATSPLTADVATGFTMLAGASPKSGTLGNVLITLKDMHDPDGAGTHSGWPIMDAGDGMKVTHSSVMGSGSAVIAGDFSAGTYTVGGAAAALKDAAGKDLEKYTEGDNKGKVINPAEAATATFAVSATGTPARHPAAMATHALIVKPFVINVDKNETPIPVGSYTATTKAGPSNMHAAAIADVTGQAIGSIRHNGTTVQIGYLTTFEGHNQRLVIVNRGPLDVDYSLDFVTEEGTEATAGHMATGEIGPESTAVIQTRDLVSFAEGGTTRASATLTLTANPSDISVSTTLVNTMDRSTDTVNYH